MRIRIIAAPLLLALAACGTSQPGTDAGGNRVAATSSPAGGYRHCALGQPLDKCPFVTGGAAAEQPSQVPDDTATDDPETTTAPAGIQAFKLGEAATVTQDDGDAAGTITISSATTWRRSTSSLGRRPKYGRYLRVTVVGLSTTGMFGLNPFDFYVVGPDGTHYSHGGGNALTEYGDDSLNDVQLNPGEKIRATLTFDVPRGVESLAYAPGSQTLATWKLTVK